MRPPIKNQNMHTGKYSFTKKALSSLQRIFLINQFSIGPFRRVLATLSHNIERTIFSAQQQHKICNAIQVHKTDCTSVHTEPQIQISISWMSSTGHSVTTAVVKY